MRFLEHYFTEAKYEKWDEAKQQSAELQSALKVMKKLNDAGFEAMIVGGAVRDFVLGKIPNDIDITTNATPDEVDKVFGKTYDIGKNKAMGVSVVKEGDFTFEVATYRTDAYDDITKGKGADKVELSTSFKDDTARRDFTINALGIDADGNIVDHHGGIEHIDKKVISTVGDPNLRFAEDRVRQLRAIRFASRLGFDIDEKTMNAIKSNAPEIQKVAAERLAKEILKMAEQTGEKFAAAIQLLDQAELLQYILPEIYGLKEMPHNPIHHPEGGSKVLGHVLEALKTNKVADPTLNLAILFHDVGKLTTHGDGDTYHGHAGESKPLINKIAASLKLDNELRDAMLFAAENHMKVGDFLDMSNNKIAQLMSNKNFDLLMKVAEADFKARGETKFDQKEWDDIQKKIANIKEKFKDNDAIKAIRKVVNGNMVMGLRPEIKPSKAMGDIIDKTTAWILDNDIDVVKDINTIEDFIKGA
jgi:tRNA nucleotidyltransferase/poly(A) polymerase